jgi:hypothetical protein
MKTALLAASLLFLVGRSDMAVLTLDASASDTVAFEIPDRVLQAYADVEPAAIEKSLSRCRSSHGEVYKVSWSTGYEVGSLILLDDGEILGMNRQSDTTIGSDEYDETKLFDCMIMK